MKSECKDRKLIVNADDFGLTAGVNAAVTECARFGILRSATIMANGPAFDDALKCAAQLEDFGVGIHFVLTGLRPLSDSAAIPELAGADGSLPAGPSELLKIVLSRRDAIRELKRELLVQAEKVFDSGITPTHFDTHKHVHIIPPVLSTVVEIARRFSVKWVRNPFEGPGAFGFLFDVEKGKRGKFLKQYCKALTVRSAYPLFRSCIRRAGMNCPEYFHGVSSTGFLNDRMIVRLSRMLKPGIHELMTHPGYLDAELERQKTRLLYSREMERQILVSDHLKKQFERNDITLSHFGEVNQ